MEPIRTQRAFSAGKNPNQGLRSFARNTVIRVLSWSRKPGRPGGRVHFPFYHTVFDDERQGFADQLDWMRRYGEFIGLNDAVALLTGGGSIDGTYFCVTFDDGFKNNATNALPILVDKDVPAAVFVATRYIGLDPERDREELLGFYRGGGRLMEFLDWDDCRALVAAGMTIGSHTASHAHLSDLHAEAVEAEMRESKETIERELGRECAHFCCPWGRPGADFRPERDPEIARQVGYRSFLTTQRGPSLANASPFAVRRDHVEALWRTYQLRYFLS